MNAISPLRPVALSIVKVKYRIGRGQSWIIYMKDIVYVYIAVLALEDLLKRFNINDPILIRYLLIIMIPLYFLVCYLIGYYDEHWGIWKMEAVYGSKDLNPFVEEMNRKIEDIHRNLK